MRSIRSARRSLALLTIPLLMLGAACSEITSLEQSNPGSILAPGSEMLFQTPYWAIQERRNRCPSALRK